MSYSQQHLIETSEIALAISADTVEEIVKLLNKVKESKGRIFFLGVGGSAANASHAVNDFRKLAGIESYAPTDNVAELTARTNDEGWITVFSGWLKVSNLNSADCLFIFSVGGGNKELGISANLCEAIDYGKKVKAKIIGITGREDGYTAEMADVCLVIPVVNSKTITPHSESFQSVIWHLLVSHPILKLNSTKW